MIGPKDKIDLGYSDGSGQIRRACKTLGHRRLVERLGRPHTNSITARANRFLLEGARTLLTHVGLYMRWRPGAVRHFCVADTSSRKVLDGETPSGRRHGHPFGWTTVPCGALVRYQPPPKKGTSGVDEFGPINAERHLRRALHAPGRETWPKEYLLIDLEAFEGSPNGMFVPLLRVVRSAIPEGHSQFHAGAFATEDNTELYPVEIGQPAASARLTGQDIDVSDCRTPSGSRLALVCAHPATARSEKDTPESASSAFGDRRRANTHVGA